MKKRAGIFDPWRQERPAPPPDPKPVSLEESGDDARPFRFAGKRGGIIVWLTTRDDKHALMQAKTNILAAIIKLLADPALFSVFRTRGISTETVDTEQERYMTHFSDGARTIVVRGGYEDAVDAMTFALREAMRTKESVAAYLTSLGIRPYIK